MNVSKNSKEMARPRKNNAEYFSHDAGMRNNRKVKALRKNHGVQGYAVFCMTLEMLTDADNFIVTVDDLEMELIAADFGFTTVELRDIWNTAKNLRLIQFENDQISCPALNERLQPVLDERVRQREKALKRWENNGKTKPVNSSTKVLPRENIATAMQSKGKEIKQNKNIYRAFAHLKMTVAEFEKLLSDGYSKDQVDDILDSIENYKDNKKYTSLNLTARKWLKKEHPKPEPQQKQQISEFDPSYFTNQTKEYNAQKRN